MAGKLFFALRPTVAALAVCVSTGTMATVAVGQTVALQPIFAPPTPAEVQAVRNDWASRNLDISDFRLDAAYVEASTGYRYEVVSHVIDGDRHYGAIRYPANYVPGSSYPVLVVCHGGVAGVAVEELSNLTSPMPGQCVEDQFFMVMPSYRGETLSSAQAGIFTSEGEQSWANYDVDDTQALLSLALDNRPDMDRARIAAWGISRGGCVALQLAIRDDRIRRVVDLFAFTDLSLPTVVARVDAIVNHGVAPTGLGSLVVDTIIDPYVQGHLSLAEARLEWLRRSPAYFVEDLPPIQAHHGLMDTQVDATHTQALLDSLAAYAGLLTDPEGYYYPTGLHGVNSLVGHGAVSEPFLCEINNGPSGYCGPMTVNTSGYVAGLDWLGEPSISNSSFSVRVHQCVPGSAGLFFVSPGTTYLASGAGYLCLGPGFQRLGVVGIDPAGGGEFRLDFGAAPAAAQSVLAGNSTVYFQFAFRDIGNPNGNWNFSNGLSVPMLP